MSPMGAADPYGGYGGMMGADPYAGYGGMMAGYGAHDQFGALQAPAYSLSSGPMLNPQGGVTYTIQVPDAAVSSILGRGGVVIKELMQQSGAQIKISQKGEYAPGTSNRIVSITGSQQSAQLAHTLVQSKLPHI